MTRFVHNERFVSAAILLAGVIWGLFWFPMRLLNEAGIGPAWAALLFNVIACILLLPLASFRGQGLRTLTRSQAITALLNGGGFSLYAVALVISDVSKAILLFYLMPVWAVLLSRWVLGHKITRTRAITLGTGMGGLVLVLGAGNGVPVPSSLGDGLALAAGMMWALAALRIYSGGSDENFWASLFLFFVAAAAMSAVLIGVLGLPAPHWPIVVGKIPHGAAAAVFFLIFPTILMMWGSARIPPARVGILLMSEIVVGLLSAWLVLGESFGWSALLGSILIMSSGGLEVFARSSTSPSATGTTH
jgi:drug/metabolite transporter (DMT)-like permease